MLSETKDFSSREPISLTNLKIKNIISTEPFIRFRGRGISFSCRISVKVSAEEPTRRCS